MQAIAAILTGVGFLAIVAGGFLWMALSVLVAWQAGLLGGLYSFSVVRRSEATNKLLLETMKVERNSTLGKVANRCMMFGTFCAIIGGATLGILALVNLKAH